MENYALVQRPAPYSWEAMTTLAATEQSTPPIKVTFPRSCTIVSAYPSVAVHSGLIALPFPTLDDLLVRIEVDTGLERRLTSRFDSTLLNGQGSLGDVTLGSFRDSTGGARILEYVMTTDGRPEIQVSFAWKRAILGGPWFQNIVVGLVFHAKFNT